MGLQPPHVAARPGTVQGGPVREKTLRGGPTFEAETAPQNTAPTDRTRIAELASTNLLERNCAPFRSRPKMRSRACQDAKVAKRFRTCADNAMTKLLLENCFFIDVLDWNRHGYLRFATTFDRTWSVDGEEVGSLTCASKRRTVALYGREGFFGSAFQKQCIDIVWTPCRFGGERPWLVCSAMRSGRRCNRRATKLYAFKSPFACRLCHQLAFASQYMPKDEMNARKAQKIRRRLAGEGELPDAFPPKPRGMHKRTFDRLRQLHDEAEEAAAAGLINFISRRFLAVASG
jgi:hypothetical protein